MITNSNFFFTKTRVNCENYWRIFPFWLPQNFLKSHLRLYTMHPFNYLLLLWMSFVSSEIEGLTTHYLFSSSVQKMETSGYEVMAPFESSWLPWGLHIIQGDWRYFLNIWGTFFKTQSLLQLCFILKWWHISRELTIIHVAMTTYYYILRDLQ